MKQGRRVKIWTSGRGVHAGEGCSLIFFASDLAGSLALLPDINSGTSFIY